MDGKRQLDFLIMGAQKAGTTALAYFLVQHPEIYIPNRKEIHFFDDDAFFKSSVDSVDYRFYHQEFDVPPRAKAVGEATPIYMYWKPAAERINRYNPSIKMIFLLRNPVERAYSHYNWARNVMMRESLPFSIAMRLERIRRVGEFPTQSRWHSYIDRGYYARQISRLLQHFSLSQMLFIKSEDLRDNHASTLNRVFGFLGVRRISDITPANIYQNQYPPMAEFERIYLLKKFEKDIKDLEKLLAWDCSGWLTAHKQEPIQS